MSAAGALGCQVAAVKAVTQVESRGSGFLASGEPVILFERHWMYKLLVKKGVTPVISDVCDPKAGGYKGGKAEHDRLAKAVLIDRDCALQSASWGLFQIMGFNYKILGYANIQAFVNDACKSEATQLNMFVKFLKANPSMLSALRSRDWENFAKLYNGPRYKDNHYDTKLKTAYDSYMPKLQT